MLNFIYITYKPFVVLFY